MERAPHHSMRGAIVFSHDGFVCTVCGYVYEGADMPDDFVCPLCHHPKSDFKPLE